MPAEGLDWLPGDQLLDFDELTRLLRIAVTRLGITNVRFTGGEPLVSRQLEEVIAATAALRPRPEITLTTNGIGLAAPRGGAEGRRAGPGQRVAGHRRRRALRPHHPPRPPRRRAGRPRRGARAGLPPVKVNAVLDPVTGLDDAVSLLRFCLDHGYQLRIIEQMPLDAGHSGARRRPLAPTTSLPALRRHFDLMPDPTPRGSAPAQLWRVDGGPATVGIIASVSHAFCSACDRTRLTADGQVRSCLFSREETDLRGLMRGGADDDAVEAAWRAAMWAKPAGHGINDPGFVQPDRPMSAIGG